MELKDNIRRLREEKGLTQEQLAKELGVTRPAVTQWESGWSQPKISTIKDMAALFGVSVNSVIDGGLQYSDAGWVKVPLFGRIAAGDPLEMEDAGDWGMIPAQIAQRHPGCFLLTVTGESMNRILPNGCHAVVEPCSDVERDGMPYAVCVNGYDATVKRVRRLESGLELIPDSTDPTFKPRVYDREVPTDDVVSVIGRVVYHVMPFDWEY